MNARTQVDDDRPIPFIDLKSQYLALRDDINSRIQRVLDHGQYIMGPEVRELEEELASFSGAKYCVSVASGTEALLISLMALGVSRGDEIITTPFTFAATAEVIALLGATPIFVDIEEDTCNIDASKIEEKISSRTKAIMPVSLYGQCSDMNAINGIAEKYRIPVVEDAAQSFGSTYFGKKSCNLSTIGCTSFFPSKPLGCYGDGGAIFTNDHSLAQACKEIRVHGQSARYTHTRIGVGGRMDTIQCAVVLAKLRVFEDEIAKRIEVGHLYSRLIIESEAPMKLVAVREGRSSVWGQLTVLSKCREQLLAKLKKAAIPTAIHYPIPLHRQEAYRAFNSSDSCPISDRVSAQVFSLPMGPYIDHGTVAQIVEVCSR